MPGQKGSPVFFCRHFIKFEAIICCLVTKYVESDCRMNVSNETDKKPAMHVTLKWVVKSM